MGKDQRIELLVVAAIAAALGVALAGIIVLALRAQPIPEDLKLIAATALGALCSLLVKVGSGSQSVTVDNSTADPVPVVAGK